MLFEAIRWWFYFNIYCPLRKLRYQISDLLSVAECRAFGHKMAKLNPSNEEPEVFCLRCGREASQTLPDPDQNKADPYDHDAFEE